MKLLNKILLSAVMAMGASSAYADPVVTYNYVPMDSGGPGVFTDTWSFTGGGAGTVAGQDFDDVYIFNVLDTPNVSFVASSVVSGGVTGVDFTIHGGGYALYTWNDGTPIAGQAATLPGSVSGGVYTLSTGEYALEIAGTYVANGGSYSGVITGMPGAVTAVPEPTSWLMMLAGLTAVAGVARRRKDQA
jgi:hypothetical protein